MTSIDQNSHWQGIPVIYQLTDSYVGTLTPAKHGEKIFNQLTVFDNTNPHRFVKLASMPVQECNEGGLLISCLCYDKSKDVLRVAMAAAGSDNDGSYREMKLCSEVLESSNNLTKVPAFVKVKQIPENMGAVSNMHLVAASSQIFFICENGFFSLTVDKNTGTESLSDAKPYDSIESGATGRFMGFQPSLSPDTHLLL